MDRLTGEDRLMLWGDETWPQDIGVLAYLDGSGLLDAKGRLRSQAVRRAIEAKLHLVPRFRQLLRAPGTGMGPPLWVDDLSFDLGQHVRVLQLAAPAAEEQVLETIESVRRHRLDGSRPPWEMWLLTGLPEERIGLYVRMHHVIAGGVAGMAMLAALLDPSPHTVSPPPPPWTPRPWPTRHELVEDERRRRALARRKLLASLGRPAHMLTTLREAWPALKELIAEEPGHATSLDRLVGPGRAFRPIRGDLERFKEIAHAHGAKVNDVLLAAAAGGARRLLIGRGEPVAGVTVRIYVPVALRDADGRVEGNAVNQMVVPLPIGEADPVRRLPLIASETARRKAKVRPSVGFFINLRPIRGPIMKLVARQRVNMLSANVPGPPMPLYLAGSEVLEMFPVVPLMGRASLGVGALSYAGRLDVMVVADRDAYPDVDLFTAGFRDELERLTASVPSLA